MWKTLKQFCHLITLSVSSWTVDARTAIKTHVAHARVKARHGAPGTLREPRNENVEKMSTQPIERSLMLCYISPNLFRLRTLIRTSDSISAHRAIKIPSLHGTHHLELDLRSQYTRSAPQWTHILIRWLLHNGHRRC